MNVISNILFWISTGLLVPVIVLLIFFFIRALILIGGYMGRLMPTQKNNQQLCNELKKISPAGLDTI